MEKKWYFVLDGKQVGPVADIALKSLLKQGKISAHTMVWCAGMNDWCTLNSIPELRDTTNTPPPIPTNIFESNGRETKQNIAETIKPEKTPELKSLITTVFTSIVTLVKEITKMSIEKFRIYYPKFIEFCRAKVTLLKEISIKQKEELNKQHSSAEQTANASNKISPINQQSSVPINLTQSQLKVSLLGLLQNAKNFSHPFTKRVKEQWRKQAQKSTSFPQKTKYVIIGIAVVLIAAPLYFYSVNSDGLNLFQKLPFFSEKSTDNNQNTKSNNSSSHGFTKINGLSNAYCKALMSKDPDKIIELMYPDIVEATIMQAQQYFIPVDEPKRPRAEAISMMKSSVIMFNDLKSCKFNKTQFTVSYNEFIKDDNTMNLEYGLVYEESTINILQEITGNNFNIEEIGLLQFKLEYNSEMTYESLSDYENIAEVVIKIGNKWYIFQEDIVPL